MEKVYDRLTSGQGQSADWAELSRQINNGISSLSVEMKVGLSSDNRVT